MTDFTEAYKNKGMFIDLYHVPSDQSVDFKAFLTQFSDDYDPNWNEEEVYGRNDPLMTFENTKRTVSIGWDMPAFSAEEAQLNMGRIQKLIQFLYPSYNIRGDSRNRVATATTLAAGPLLKLKFMNFVQDVSSAKTGADSIENRNGMESPDGNNAKQSGLLGKINSFSHEIDIEQGFHFRNGNMYPKLINVEFEYLTNHMHSLGWANGELREEGFPYGESIEALNEAQRSQALDEISNTLDQISDETATDEQKEAQQGKVLEPGNQ